MSIYYIDCICRYNITVWYWCCVLDSSSCIRFVYIHLKYTLINNCYINHSIFAIPLWLMFMFLHGVVQNMFSLDIYYSSKKVIVTNLMQQHQYSKDKKLILHHTNQDLNWRDEIAYYSSKKVFVITRMKQKQYKYIIPQRYFA